MILGLMVMPCMAWAQISIEAFNNKRIPTFADCQKMADAKVSAQEKIMLQLSFFPRRPYCSLIGREIKVHHIFNSGTSLQRLRLVISNKNVYELDKDSLLLALMPDKDRIPKDKALSLATKMIGTIIDAVMGGGNPAHIALLLGNATSLTMNVGDNAIAIKNELDRMRAHHELALNDVVMPDMINGLIQSRIAITPDGVLPPELKGVPPAPATFLQKFIGAVQRFITMLRGFGASPESLLEHEI